MDSKELFRTLLAEYPSQKCDELIDQAIKEGVNLDEIRNMLDYIENSNSEKLRADRDTQRPKGYGCKCLHRLMERVRRL